MALPVRDEIICLKWVKFAANPKLVNITEKLKNKCICSKHFSQKNLTANGFLLWNAIPDINPPPEVINRPDYNVLNSSLGRETKRKGNFQLSNYFQNYSSKDEDMDNKSNDLASLEK